MRRTILVFGMLCTIPVATMAEDIGDTPDGAKRTSTSGRVKETLSSATDVDFMKFEVRTDRDNPEHDTSGNLTVNFSQKAPPGANPNSGWRIDLYSQTDLANSLYTAILPETSLDIEFEQGLSVGTYYYKVSSLDTEAFPTKEYTLKGSWEESPNYEKQPNDNADTATAIKANEPYYGNLSSASDVDFYRFSLLAREPSVTITLSQDSPGADSTVGWRLSLLSPSLPQQEVVDVPSTRLKASTPPLNLEVGVHYVFIKALPQQSDEVQEGSEADKKPENETAPVGRPYQLTVNAPSVPLPPENCPFVFTYAQNPVTSRWATFPTPCDVPAGWFSQQIPPDTSEVCPSPHASYTFSKTNEDGTVQPAIVKIPLVDFEDETGKYLFRVNLEQINTFELFQFQLQLDTLKLIRVVEDKTVVEQPPATE